MKVVTIDVHGVFSSGLRRKQGFYVYRNKRLLFWEPGLN